MKTYIQNSSYQMSWNELSFKLPFKKFEEKKKGYAMLRSESSIVSQSPRGMESIKLDVLEQFDERSRSQEETLV